MKNLKIILLVALTTCLTFSCGKDEDEPGAPLVRDGGPFEISELTGSWEATKAEFFRVTDGMWVDVVGEGGSFSLTVTSSGRCTFIIDPVDREPYTESGEMFWSSYEGDVALAIVWDGSNPDDRSSFTGHELTSTTFNLGCLSECAEYDYNNNGTSDTADVNFEFIRI